MGQFNSCSDGDKTFVQCPSTSAAGRGVSPAGHPAGIHLVTFRAIGAPGGFMPRSGRSRESGSGRPGRRWGLKNFHGPMPRIHPAAVPDVLRVCSRIRRCASGQIRQRCHSEARPRRSVLSHQRLQGRGIRCRIAGGQTRQPVHTPRPRYGWPGPVPERYDGSPAADSRFLSRRAGSGVGRRVRCGASFEMTSGRERRGFLNRL